MRARCRASDHSILAPEMAISSAHFLISEWMKAAKASGELAMLSMPWDSNLSRMSSDWLRSDPGAGDGDQFGPFPDFGMDESRESLGRIGHAFYALGFKLGPHVVRLADLVHQGA